MSQIAERRRGSDQEHRDAVEEHVESSTGPSDVELLAALRTVRSWLGLVGAAPLYDQRAGHLPPDAKSAGAYKRRHRELRKRGVPGVYVRGKLLVCTREAWATEPPRAPRVTVVRNEAPVDALDAALGIRTRRTR
ncbi:MAG TPA: hypothetical protein VK841_01090 [Polyangiaceae bacterium]|jgi:hypothetical protein|nr:hypothetical protein [Polyangiaceae bacterium]